MPDPTSPLLVPPLLLATDGSPNARYAQQLLYPIARALPAQVKNTGRPLITLLRVQPRSSSRPVGQWRQRLSRRQLPNQAEREADSATVTLSKPTEQNGHATTPEPLISLLTTDFPADLPIDLQIRQGRPVTEILTCARSIQAGLIAVGAQGYGGMRELLLGSVSAAIARYAPCSVLVARGTPQETDVSLRHGLLVVSDPLATRQAIAATRQLVAAGIRQVTILYIQPPLNADYLFGPFVTPTPSWHLSQSLQAVQKEQSQELLEAVKAALASLQLDITTLLQTGDAAPLICQVAQQRQVDLVILGSHAARRWLNLPSQTTLLSPLKAIARRSQPESERPPTESRPQLTRLTTTEDYIIHHAPCPVLLCRGAATGEVMTGFPRTE